MKEKAKKALKKSIQHWEKNYISVKKSYTNNTNIASSGFTIGPLYCSLCKEFAIDISSDSCCIGCPVYEFTGKKSCFNTPFEDVDNNLFEEIASKKLVKYVKKELDFLKSLLIE